MRVFPLWRLVVVIVILIVVVVVVVVVVAERDRRGLFAGAAGDWQVKKLRDWGDCEIGEAENRAGRAPSTHR
jgi:hypothetical protein